MNRTKRILSLLLTLVLALGLTACGGNNDQTQTPDDSQQPSTNQPADTQQPADTAPSDEEVTLHWAVWDVNLTTYYQPLIDAYVADHPNVKIEMVDLGSADYQNALITQLTGNADLDVVCVKDIPGYANLVKGGYLTP